MTTIALDEFLKIPRCRDKLSTFVLYTLSLSVHHRNALERKGLAYVGEAIVFLRAAGIKPEPKIVQDWEDWSLESKALLELERLGFDGKTQVVGRSGKPVTAQQIRTALDQATTIRADKFVKNKNCLIRIETLPFSPRAYNALHAADIAYAGEIAARNGEILVSQRGYRGFVKNFGRESLAETRRILESLGLGFDTKVVDQSDNIVGPEQIREALNVAGRAKLEQRIAQLRSFDEVCADLCLSELEKKVIYAYFMATPRLSFKKIGEKLLASDTVKLSVATLRARGITEGILAKLQHRGTLPTFIRSFLAERAQMARTRVRHAITERALTRRPSTTRQIAANRKLTVRDASHGLTEGDRKLLKRVAGLEHKQLNALILA